MRARSATGNTSRDETGGTRRRHNRRIEPYAWLGAGAVTLAVGAAALVGAGIAAADESGADAPSSRSSAESTPRASGGVDGSGEDGTGTPESGGTFFANATSAETEASPDDADLDAGSDEDRADEPGAEQESAGDPAAGDGDIEAAADGAPSTGQPLGERAKVSKDADRQTITVSTTADLAPESAHVDDAVAASEPAGGVVPVEDSAQTVLTERPTVGSAEPRVLATSPVAAVETAALTPPIKAFGALTSALLGDPAGPVESPLVVALLAAVRRSFGGAATDSGARQRMSAAAMASAAVNTAPTLVVTASGADPSTGAVRVTIVANDPDGEPAGFFGTNASLVGNVQWVGGITVNGSTSSASFVYTPTAATRHAAAAVGAPATAKTAKLTVEVQDSYGGRTVGSVVVPIAPQNKAPVVTTATAGTPSASKGAVTGRVTATDADNDTVTYSASSTAKGKVSINSKSGAFTYTPTAAARHAAAATNASAAAKTDNFTVTLSDGHGGLVTKTITVALAPKNRTPTIRVSVGKADKATGTVTGKIVGADADKDSLTYSASSAAKGSLTVDAATGKFTYTPTVTARRAAAATGATKAARVDTFTLTVSDGHGGTVTKTVTVTISPLKGGTAPIVGTINVGQPDSISGVVRGSVGASDAEGDPLTFTVGTAPTKGTVSVAADGSFSYTPTASRRHTTTTLTDTFTVIISDGTLTTVANVSVPVAPIPDHLDAGQWLQPGQYITSRNGRYKLVMQTDGNLVQYDNQTNSALWATGTNGRPGLRAAMQSDGNFVLYTQSPQTGVWSTKTNGYPGARIVLQDDGNLVVYQGSTALWDRRAGRLNPGGGGGGGGGVRGDDYPAHLKNAALDSKVDPWGFYNRECTSFVAWRLNSVNGVAFTNTMRGGRWGNATNWAANARQLGYTVNNTPAVGSVGWLSSGHVAWVAAINGDSVVIEEYNYGYTGVYKTRTVSKSYFNAYIHIKDL